MVKYWKYLSIVTDIWGDYRFAPTFSLGNECSPSTLMPRWVPSPLIRLWYTRLYLRKRNVTACSYEAIMISQCIIAKKYRSSLENTGVSYSSLVILSSKSKTFHLFVFPCDHAFFLILMQNHLVLSIIQKFLFRFLEAFLLQNPSLSTKFLIVTGLL